MILTGTIEVLGGLDAAGAGRVTPARSGHIPAPGVHARRHVGLLLA